MYVGRPNKHLRTEKHRVVISWPRSFQAVRLRGVRFFYRASYGSAVLAVILCLSVRLAVCLSQVGVVQIWLNLGSHYNAIR